MLIRDLRICTKRKFNLLSLIQNQYPKFAMALLISLTCACTSMNDAQEPTSEIKAQGVDPESKPRKRRGPRPNKTNTTTVVSAQKIKPTVVSYPDYNDPLIKLNRTVFAFNDFTYRYALIPLSKGYLNIVPTPIQTGISNFFYNIKTPIYAFNHLLQGEPRPAGNALLRFGINFTVGILGFFDPARDWWRMERQEIHLQDTLASYGAGYGFYLVLPIIGPSDARNGVSRIGDYFLNPIVYTIDSPRSTYAQAFDGFHAFAPNATNYEKLRDKSRDPYIFFRNMYLQGIQRDEDY